MQTCWDQDRLRPIKIHGAVAGFQNNLSTVDLALKHKLAHPQRNQSPSPWQGLRLQGKTGEAPDICSVEVRSLLQLLSFSLMSMTQSENLNAKS